MSPHSLLYRYSRIVKTALIVLIYATAVAVGPAYAAGQIFVVTTTADTNDGCATNGCSLRDAINAANADSTLDTIQFNIPGSGQQVITLLSALPQPTSPVFIDGTT